MIKQGGKKMNILKNEKIRKIYDRIIIKSVLLFLMLISEKQINLCFISQEKSELFTSIMTIIELVLLFLMAVNILHIYKQAKKSLEENQIN